ncbi:peptide deformylase [Helcococcus kunzii]|uniref:peptide deformylase n=1 Tax=Helcococcus kunzii TaxID=40091 RepID=UPI0038ACC91F
MGLRQIRKDNDPLLLKKSREIKEVNDRILNLLGDMVETMYHENGIGLAAPQVGVLRRCFVVDIGDGNVYKIINPEIIEKSETTSVDIEGCLSIPNYNCTVERSETVKMKYTDTKGKEQIIEADGLLARCLLHEYDHLDGVLITSKAIEVVTEENIDDIREKYDLYSDEEEQEVEEEK